MREVEGRALEVPHKPHKYLVYVRYIHTYIHTYIRMYTYIDTYVYIHTNYICRFMRHDVLGYLKQCPLQYLYNIYNHPVFKPFMK